MADGKRFVLLDRDGTIIFDKHYLSDPDEVQLLPGAAQGLRRMRELGFGIIVVSNQSGVGRGYFDLDSVAAVTARLRELLRVEGVELDGAYFCPHAPEENCDCRKPAPGMLLRAAEEHGFDPAACVVVGDKACDVKLGKNAGAKAVLVATGKGEKERGKCSPDHFAKDLADVADWLAALPR